MVLQHILRASLLQTYICIFLCINSLHRKEILVQHFSQLGGFISVRIAQHKIKQFETIMKYLTDTQITRHISYFKYHLGHLSFLVHNPAHLHMYIVHAFYYLSLYLKIQSPNNDVCKFCAEIIHTYNTNAFAQLCSHIPQQCILPSGQFT